MPSSNPALNDKVFEREMARAPDADQVGWAAPAPDQISPWTPAPPPPDQPGVTTAPGQAGFDTMRISGVATASGVLLVVLVAVAWVGWQGVKTGVGVDDTGRSVVTASLPGWLLPAVLVGLGLAIVTIMKPKLARFTAVFYAAVEGAVLGAISHLYAAQFNGIVLQAVGLTLGVFVMMLFLYATRIIKVTDRFRRGVIAATGAILLVYLVSIVLHLFGATIPFINDAGPVGIAFSLLVVGLAALNLTLDFDLVERGVQAGAPRYMEWYCAFGLLVTLVWLYLELLRLLAKLQRR